MDYAASKQFVSPRGVPAACDGSTAWCWELDGGITAARQETWLLSFIDILALLLTLLVLLLAYQDQDHRLEQEPGANAAQNDTGPVVPLQSLLSPYHTALPLPSALDTARGYAMPGEGLLPQTVATAGVAPGTVPEEFATSAEPDAPADTAAPEQPVHSPAETPSEAMPASFESLANAAESEPAPVLGPLEPPVHVAAEGPDAGVLARFEPVYSLAASAPAAVVAPLDIASRPTVATPLDRVMDALQKSRLQERVEVVVGSNDVSLEISDSILFAPASAALSETGSGLLDELATLLQSVPYSLSVEGHSDNRPIQTARYPSNWELSSARAAAVTRALIEKGIAPERIRAIGYGDTRPRDDNGSAAGRARNRRVTFVLQLEAEA